MEGTVIGTYRVQRKLGEGGMGAVYQAEHTLLGRQAAIKVLLPALSANQEIVNRFFNEAKATTSIADPGIVQVFDYGYHTDGSAYIVMEFLQGESLDARLRRLRRFAPSDALRLTRQICVSLQAAHSKGIVHRDLKPENIFVVGDPAVTGGERPKILDFGIAKLASDEPGRMKTRTGSLIGTPVYMSPEQCRGAGDIDHRSDVYALGCVLFCMLTGRPPFDGEGMGEIIAAHLREPPPAPSSMAPDIPQFIDELVLRCLQKQPAQRFQSMTEMAQALGQAESMVMGVPPYMSHATPMHGGYPSQPYMSRPPSQVGAPAGAVTTLSTANGQAGGGTGAGLTGAGVGTPRKGRGALFAGLGVAVVAAAVVVFLVVKPGGGSGEPAAASGGADAGATALGGAADAGVATAPVDAAVAASAPRDAATVATSPVDAAVVAPPVDAAAVASSSSSSKKGSSSSSSSSSKRGKKDAGTSSGSGSGSGYIDRGD